MHCFDIEASPRPGTTAADEFESALVNCYVNFPLRDGAELLARHYIEDESDWIAGETKSHAWFEEEDFAGRPEHLERFHVALKVGFCVHIHAFARRADDDDRELIN